MKNLMAVGLVCACASIVMPGSFVFGQSTQSSLSGVVFDPTDAVIPGVEISAKNNATGVEAKSITAENGTFSIPAMDPGTYTVSATLPGFKQAILNNVKLDAGVPATVRVTLEVGNRAETVEVQAGAEILHVEKLWLLRPDLPRLPLLIQGGDAYET